MKLFIYMSSLIQVPGDPTWVAHARAFMWQQYPFLLKFEIMAMVSMEVRIPHTELQEFMEEKNNNLKDTHIVVLRECYTCMNGWKNGMHYYSFMMPHYIPLWTRISYNVKLSWVGTGRDVKIHSPLIICCTKKIQELSFFSMPKCSTLSTIDSTRLSSHLNQCYWSRFDIDKKSDRLCMFRPEQVH